jgi:uncharacterized membrane protein SpoIIM required for sporulation/uncharacterized RDD family membrane protein YckC
MMQAAPDLVVESVTGVDVALPVAGPGARSFAFLIDWHIRASAAVAWYVLGALIYNGRFSLAPPLSPEAGWFIGVVSPAAVIFFLYHPLLEVAMRGRTPGKRIAGVRLVTRAGGAPAVGALLTRNVFRIVDSFPFLYGVGLVATLVTRDHVRIGDLAAGTLLIYDRTPAPGPSPAPRAASAHELALRRTLLARAELWRSAAARVQRLADGRTDDGQEAARVADDYRLLAHDLARARRLLPGSPEHQYLEAAYAQAHATLHKPGWHAGHALLGLFREEIPQVVTQLRPYIVWSTAIFLLTVAAGYALVAAYPALIALFASPELIASVERGQLWTEGLLNIVVSLFAYCAGFLFGLGTLYILGLNGMMLGAAFAFTSLHGLGGALFQFVIPHGPVEISVMCLSGAAGAAVGEALIRPSHATRAESFRAAAAQSGKLLIACAVLLVGSGLIEGYVSANPEIPLWARVVIGVAYWIAMLALLRGWFFRARFKLAASA